jgi:hypothetical protein
MHCRQHALQAAHALLASPLKGNREIAMSRPQARSAAQTEPNDPPPPQEEPTRDVPVYPEQDPTPGREMDGGGSDVDEDDLDPQSPHSPPD